jgi:hypothetical protein
MTDQQPQQSLRVHTPCHRAWESLEGDRERRFCSDCSLHVLDAALLTREQALRIVRESSGRVCMRLECGPSGQAIFRDSPKRERLAVLALSAAAGLLAACDEATPVVPQDASPGSPSVLVPEEPELEPELLEELLGYVSIDEPSDVPPPEAEPSTDDE